MLKVPSPGNKVLAQPKRCWPRSSNIWVINIFGKIISILNSKISYITCTGLVSNSKAGQILNQFLLLLLNRFSLCRAGFNGLSDGLLSLKVIIEYSKL